MIADDINSRGRMKNGDHEERKIEIEQVKVDWAIGTSNSVTR